MNTKFEEVYDYLDKIKKASLDEGGVILGNLDVKGNITKNAQELVTHNTDKSIISDGTFNRGSWNMPTEGALTQILDNSSAQHSVIVGRGEDGNRYYGIDFLDAYSDPNIRLYSGNHYLQIGKHFEYDGKIVGAKNAVTLKLQTRKHIDYANPWTGYEIPLDTFNGNNIDNLFSQSGNGIKVNRNANLLISGNVGILHSSADSNELDVSLWGSSLGNLAVDFGRRQVNMKTYCFSELFYSVPAGEIISSSMSAGIADTYTILESATWLTIQEV